MRAVLVTIADAANRDGQHAHPGITAMIEGSLYSHATVSRILKALRAGGWIEVERDGGGRGVATVYRIPGVLQKPPHHEDVYDTETTSPRGGLQPETTSFEAETTSRRRSDQHVSAPYGLYNGTAAAHVDREVDRRVTARKAAGETFGNESAIRQLVAQDVRSELDASRGARLASAQAFGENRVGVVGVTEDEIRAAFCDAAEADAAVAAWSRGVAS